MDEYIQRSIIETERVILVFRSKMRDYRNHVDFYTAEASACEQNIEEAEEFLAKLKNERESNLRKRRVKP